MSQKYPEGAIIMSEYISGRRKILGCAGEVRFLSDRDDLNFYFSTATVNTLEKEGWTVEETPWVPTVDEKYWYVDEMARVCSRFYFSPNQPDDKALTELGNCYRTQELAQAAAERMRKAYRGEK